MTLQRIALKQRVITKSGLIVSFVNRRVSRLVMRELFTHSRYRGSAYQVGSSGLIMAERRML